MTTEEALQAFERFPPFAEWALRYGPWRDIPSPNTSLVDETCARLRDAAKTIRAATETPT